MAVVVAAAALGAYLLAGATSLFAVERLEVRGGSPAVRRSVERVLTVARGESLVGIDLDRLAGLAEELPTVSAVSFDRAFPHTLEVTVVPERPVAVVRRRGEAYLVSARGRVIAGVGRRSHGKLPRIWAGRTVSLEVGALAPVELMPAVRAVTPLRRIRFPARVVAVRAAGEDLALRLRSGLQVRLGGREDVLLKLAVAAAVLPKVAPDAEYLDVSVPGRPVAGVDPVAVAPAVVTSAVSTSEDASLTAGSDSAVDEAQPQAEIESSTSTGP